jgi:hypothetical protein
MKSWGVIAIINFLFIILLQVNFDAAVYIKRAVVVSYFICFGFVVVTGQQKVCISNIRLLY